MIAQEAAQVSIIVINLQAACKAPPTLENFSSCGYGPVSMSPSVDWYLRPESE